MQRKILAIVPAYNEEGNIKDVINDIREAIPSCSIMVVNDYSTDATSAAAKETGCTMVIDLPCNLGIGGAVQTGFMYAHEKGYDLAVQIDGDGQHIPSELSKLIEKMNETGCDVVIGSRFLNDSSSNTSSESDESDNFKSTRTRRAGIKLFAVLLKWLTGVQVTDATSGFRLYNRQSIKLLARHYPDDYPEPEAIVLLSRNGFKITEAPVFMKERQSGKSSITPFKSVYYMAKVVLSIFIANFRKRSI